ncbi:MAG: RsmD family RNA methyltransferase [Fidelibacterota bacterium]
MGGTLILAGKFKGTRLRTGTARRIRPTLSRVRQGIFDLLADVSGKVVLDLYAGAGTLGFEALSRGAESVIFVDRDREAIRVIKRNSGLFTGIRISVERGDSLGFLRNSRKKYDIIMADPPYGGEDLGHLEEAAAARLEPGGILMIESSFREQWRHEDAIIKRYGDTQISIFRNNP